MALYQIGKRLSYIKETPFKLEREIQRTVEENLLALLGLELVKSEFSIKNRRIDTLAYDPESKAFIIIEYKRNKNFSVIDQGYAYMALMLNNKSDFILEYNETQSKRLKRDEIEWSQSRVIFVSQGFTQYQREAINFKDLPIELWEIKGFQNDTISFQRIQNSGAEESIKTISKQNDSIASVSREIKVYSEDEHLASVSDDMRELYDQLKSSLLDVKDFEVKPKKKYIAFVLGKNILDVHPQKKGLKIWLNMPFGNLEDPKGLARNVQNIGHWGNGDYEIQLRSDEHLDYVMMLIKQSIKWNQK